ncbi:hypothetical protein CHINAEXTREME_03145 [Halobiforma lacisalsi AJ5]|uniref:Uncharacterized protein n=1 Tax=Natronobacterium lacisalsi AJ5 TaxID=358396 RepID=M0LSM7_NATLA|nr:hypothetical protein [Halobiforma lacisalsi]APW96827.1 hypothetical protein CHINAEXTREME_03145 [Halobiforma lacisalsi AJ5]EMA35100.1 hypothetical protein C445_06375 [Halobiforma lacisalsi AJ5]
METADNCRRAAFEAVADVEPPRLHALVESVLDEASMVPGVLALESAAAVTTEANANATANAKAKANASAASTNGQPPLEQSDAPTVDADDFDGIVTHAAGVQLIYEGLRLTRALAHDEPWTTPIGGQETETDADTEADLEILAADILVARGFYLLSRTEAANTAVRTVQSFGRDQTRREDLLGERADDGDVDTDANPSPNPNADDRVERAAELDANLERDVLELAVRTGAAAAGEAPPPRLLSVADDIATQVGTSFPPVEECFDGPDAPISDRSLEDHTTDRATSATDP